MARTKREDLPLPTRVAELPVQHLQLRDATARAAARMHTIGAAARELKNKKSLQPWKKIERQELASALADLRACVTGDGAVDFARFYGVRPVRNTCGKMYYASEHLELLVARHGDIGIGELQLRVHIAAPLIKGGITTLGRLLNALRVGLAIPPHRNQRYSSELLPRLTAVTRCSGPEGKVDWDCFAKHQRIPIMRSGAGSRSDAITLSQFYGVVGAAIRFEFGEAAYLITKSRLIVPLGDEPKLSDVGRSTGMTKEGVRQWEATVLTNLKRIIWHNDYTAWRCRLPDRLRRYICEFLGNFKVRNRNVFLRSEWEVAAATYFGLRNSSGLSESRLLIGLADLTPFRFLPEDAWSALASTEVSPARLQKARALIDKTLTVGCPNGLPLSRIRQTIAKAHASPLSADDVRCLLSSLPEIRYDNKKRRYHVERSKLRLHDALEQTLRAAGRPVSLRSFQQRFRDEAGRPRWTLGSIVTEIAKDPRFVPVGLTGKRALREWTQIETRSIPDIAAEIVQTASGPVSEAQLYSEISRRRSLRFGSIRSLLLLDRRFKRVSMGWWAPAE